MRGLFHYVFSHLFLVVAGGEGGSGGIERRM